MLVGSISFATACETAGAARIRSSLRPLFEGKDFQQNSGRIAPRDREGVFVARMSAAISGSVNSSHGRRSAHSGYGGGAGFAPVSPDGIFPRLPRSPRQARKIPGTRNASGERFD